MSTPTHDLDPFEQAGSAEEVEVPQEVKQSSEAIHVEPIDDVEESTPEIGATSRQPQSSPLAPQSHPPVPKKGFPIAGLLAAPALVVSIGAAAGVVYSLSQTGQLRDDVTVAFTDVDDNIAALGNRQTESEVKISQVRETAGQNTVQIRQFDSDQLSVELAELKREMAKLDTAISKLDSEESIQALQQRVADLEALAQSLQETSTRTPRAHPPKRTVRVTKPKPKALETLDGSTVVSVDQWGYDTSVVLLDPATGEFVSVAKGGVVNGWRYEGADPKAATAKFVQGKKTVNVKIKG